VSAWPLRSLLVVPLAASAWGCASPPSDEAASLCEDLGNLAATVALIDAPPADATVGQVRGATEKLDPTIHQAERAGVVPDAEGDAFRAAQEAVISALEGIGDDASIAEVPPGRLEPIEELTARYDELIVLLRCPATGATGS
jgi:hypothetical protein